MDGASDSTLRLFRRAESLTCQPCLSVIEGRERARSLTKLGSAGDGTPSLNASQPLNVTHSPNKLKKSPQPHVECPTFLGPSPSRPYSLTLTNLEQNSTNLAVEGEHNKIIFQQQFNFIITVAATSSPRTSSPFDITIDFLTWRGDNKTRKR